jgi:hydroxymethylpyrimidine pyrophosphatase-like HAD family hydrolase
MCSRRRGFDMKVAWDIDHTLVLSNKEPQPVTISVDDEPFLNPVVVGREGDITILVTGRSYTHWKDTYDMVLSLGLKDVKQVCFNHKELYTQHHIASMKSAHLSAIGATHYVEDNPHYREVMCGYWDGKCISSKEWVEL